jgi:CheY-like chemotaxis protein
MKFEPGRIRVLLVEDHPPTAAMLSAMLKALGFARLTVAGNTTAAVEALKAAPVDLLLCDFQLGIVNGLMLVRMIRRPDGIGHPNVPIVMITAHAEPERVAEALGAGVDDFLVKPVQPEKLLRCLTVLLERPRDFVKSKDYAGPDRRRRQTEIHPGRRLEDREGRPVPRNKWIVPPKS